MEVLLIDCDDSYTYNIFDYLKQCGTSVEMIHFSDFIYTENRYSAIVLSPGPKSPKDVPILSEIIRSYQSKIPILGICLGHQAIGSFYGHEIERSTYPAHGIPSKINIAVDDIIFSNIEKSDFHAMRYNSLTVLDKADSELQVICRDLNDEIMGFKHKKFPIYSFQFHPESIGSPQGIILFQNFIKLIHNQL